MSLVGNKLAGGNPERNRVDDDFYATDPKAVEKLLLNYSFNGREFLEPCVGNGNIANTLYNFYTNKPIITALDIVNRGYPNTIIQDFLTWKTNKKFEAIITNPPYSLAQSFIEKCMELLTDETENTCNGQMAMFLKLQFLEGQKRKELFDKYPPKYIYVFRNRIGPWRDGLSKNPETGKKWASTITFAWFIWEKGSNSEPIIRWL